MKLLIFYNLKMGLAYPGNEFKQHHVNRCRNWNILKCPPSFVESINVVHICPAVYGTDRYISNRIQNNPSGHSLED